MMGRPSVLSAFALLGTLLLPATRAHAEDPADLDRQEAKLLQQHSQWARRDGLRLTLTTSKGRGLVRFESQNACTGPGDCLLYHFNGISPDGGFLVVRVSRWEGGTALWISRRDGRSYEVYRDPVLSPDGRYIVAANPSEAYDVNGVFIWELRQGTLVRRFSEVPKTYALYNFIAWQDESTVRLKRTSQEPEACSNGSLAESEVLLQRQPDGRWRLLPPAPGSLRCV